MATQISFDVHTFQSSVQKSGKIDVQNNTNNTAPVVCLDTDTNCFVLSVIKAGAVEYELYDKDDTMVHSGSAKGPDATVLFLPTIVADGSDGDNGSMQDSNGRYTIRWNVDNASYSTGKLKMKLSGAQSITGSPGALLSLARQFTTSPFIERAVFFNFGGGVLEAELTFQVT